MPDAWHWGTPRRSQFHVTCKECGMSGLRWRAESEGWRLFENERVEHNRLKLHNCRALPSAEEAMEDFDDVSNQ